MNSTGEHLLPFTFYFFNSKLHMAILKQEFGIGLRGKQKLNLDGETEMCGGGGATYDQ